MTTVRDQQSTYGELESTMSQFGGTLERLLRDLLAAAGIQAHSISFRVKSWQSASAKISKASGKYASLTDLTDLLGLRVITYFASDVDAVAEVIRREFDIDPENSVDKRVTQDADRFGYLSLHFIARLGVNRIGLPEYARFAGINFEIQTRSILQHAWAEIEHDLGYKADVTLPRELRRRFSRLAGLLELADDEFCRLQGELSDYEDYVKRELESKSAAQDIEIDQSSLLAFVRSEPCIEVDKAIAAFFKDHTFLYKPTASLLRQKVVILSGLGVTSIGQLNEFVTARRDFIVRFADNWIHDTYIEASTPDPVVDPGDPEYGTVRAGIAITYIAYVIAAEKGYAVDLRWLNNYLDTEEVMFRNLRSTYVGTAAEFGLDVADIPGPASAHN